MAMDTSQTFAVSQHPANVRRRLEDPLTFFSRTMTKLFSAWVRATYPFVRIGHDVSIHYTVILNRPMAPAIKIGNSVVIGKDAWINTFDISDGEPGPKIVIDDDCLVGAADVISAKNRIHIERDVKMGWLC